MNGDRFDALARSFARAGLLRSTRRDVIAGLGLGLMASPAIARSSAHAQETRAPGGWSFGQLLLDLEYDPQEIFAFVAESVAYEPYAGVLRGGAGAMRSAGGNSADKTLLLKALLDEALVTTRLVSGPLSADAERVLRQSLVPDQATAQVALDRLLSATPGTLSQTTAPTEQQISFAEALPAARQRMLERSYAEFDDNLKVLQEALQDAGIDAPLPVAELPELERTAHVWLQYAAGSQWIDLDPSIPGAIAGTAYADGYGTADALPLDWHHSVAFTVSAEIVGGGQPVLQDLLTYDATVADLSTKPFTLVHVKPGWIGGSVADAIAGTETYEPTLLIDDLVVPGSRLAFNTEGGGALTALGGEVDAEGQPAAEWFSFEIRSPDRAPRTARRTVFDRLTPEERFGRFDYGKLPPIPQVTDPELGAVFLPMLGVYSFAIQGGPIGNGFFQQDFTIDDPVADRSAAAHGYSFVRERVQSDLLAKTGYRFFHDGPNITSFVLEPQSIKASGATVGLKFDLLNQQLGALPLSDVAPPRGAAPLLIAGALSHAAERGLAEGAASFIQPEMPVAFRAVSDVFREAVAGGLRIRVLKSDDDPGEIDCSTRARAGIAAALAQGNVVAVPERSVTIANASVIGWWEIDPISGRAIDRMEDGTGSTLPEWALLVFKMAEVMECALALGNIIVSVVNSVNKAIGDFSYHYPAHVGLHEALGLVACAAAVVH